MAVRNPRTLVAMARACVLAFGVLLVLAYASSRARWLDAHALSGFIELQGHHDHAGLLATRLSKLADPAPVLAIAAALAALAAARGRLRRAAAIAFLVGVTSVSSQVLKALLAYPRTDVSAFGSQVYPASFPSGHS